MQEININERINNIRNLLNLIDDKNTILYKNLTKEHDELTKKNILKNIYLNPDVLIVNKLIEINEINFNLKDNVAKIDSELNQIADTLPNDYGYTYHEIINKNNDTLADEIPVELPEEVEEKSIINTENSKLENIIKKHDDKEDVDIIKEMTDDEKEKHTNKNNIIYIISYLDYHCGLKIKNIKQRVEYIYSYVSNNKNKNEIKKFFHKHIFVTKYIIPDLSISNNIYSIYIKYFTILYMIILFNIEKISIDRFTFNIGDDVDIISTNLRGKIINIKSDGKCEVFLYNEDETVEVEIHEIKIHTEKYIGKRGIVIKGNYKSKHIVICQEKKEFVYVSFVENFECYGKKLHDKDVYFSQDLIIRKIPKDHIKIIEINARVNSILNHNKKKVIYNDDDDIVSFIRQIYFSIYSENIFYNDKLQNMLENKVVSDFNIFKIDTVNNYNKMILLDRSKEKNKKIIKTIFSIVEIDGIDKLFIIKNIDNLKYCKVNGKYLNVAIKDVVIIVDKKEDEIDELLEYARKKIELLDI